MIRRKTPTVQIDHVLIGSEHPIVIQSMTDTLTSDVPATVRQTIELIKAGAEMVRFTINDPAAAKAIPRIIQIIRDKGYKTPIIGDFHFNGHLLLNENPPCAKLLSKYRINPGNVGKGSKHDQNFSEIIRIALKNNKPIRIGVNAGSLDPELIADLMNKNSRKKNPKDTREIICDAMVESALRSAAYAQKLGMKKNQIILSAKMSSIPDLILVNQKLAAQCDYALHLGLTEAGSDVQGITSSAAALGILLQQGIGDTIRVSLTPQPSIPRSKEVEICQALLQSLELRFFRPKVISCPGCGRTNSNEFRSLAEKVNAHIDKNLSKWKKLFPGVEQLTMAVMGCVVNGPGESRHADIGISLPGISEEPMAPVYIKGKKVQTLRGKDIPKQFLKLLENYIVENSKTGLTKRYSY